jgi:hypothetical protein
MTEKSRDSASTQTANPAPPVQWPRETESVPATDVGVPAESPFPNSLEDGWRERIERTRSAMIAIPNDPEGRAGVRGEILRRVLEFVGRHKGHAVSHCRQTEDHEALCAVCETCRETMTVVFEYEEKPSVIREENPTGAREPVSVSCVRAQRLETR